MFEAENVLIWSGIPLIIILYCCICIFLLCRRTEKSSKVKEVKVEGKVETMKEPRRLKFIEIHQKLTGKPNGDHPILQRVHYPLPHRGTSFASIANGLLHFHRPNMATISVIDTQTKLSFNPSIIVEDFGTKNYDTLYP